MNPLVLAWFDEFKTASILDSRNGLKRFTIAVLF